MTDCKLKKENLIVNFPFSFFHLIFAFFPHFLKVSGIKKAGIFGSYARGGQTPTSDLDLLVEFSRPVSLLDIVRLERELSERLGTDVDLVTEEGVSPYLKDEIKRSVKTFYEER